MLSGEAFVHAVEITREERCLVAPGPGADFEHGGLGIGAVARQQSNGERALLVG